jgi:hypothetical protein
VIEKLKTGNYEVKFSAPLHTVQIKKVLIEKNLPSSINVELVPVEEAQKIMPSGLLNENTGPRYPVAQPTYPSQGRTTGQGTYPAGPVPSSQNYGVQNPAMPPFSSSYPSSQNSGGVSSYDSPQVPTAGHRRHRGTAGSSDPAQTGTSGYDNSGNTGQASDSLNSAVSQAGLQLVQELFAKKTDKQSTS